MSTFYQDHDIPVCPDGDKLRSDDDGLFCMVGGDRVPARIVGGVVELQLAPAPARSGKKAKATESSSDESSQTEQQQESAT